MNDAVLEIMMLMLQDAPSLQGVSVVFGEESINDEAAALPMIAVVPIGGPWFNDSGPVDQPVGIEQVWTGQESIDIYMWSSGDPNSFPAPTPIQNATAVELLRQKVLQAFQFQRPRGLVFKPVSGRWQRMGDGQNRYGRAYVMTIVVEIIVTDVLYPEVTVRNTEVSVQIEDN